MSSQDITAPSPSVSSRRDAIRRGFWQHEDWLAVIVGLGIVAVAYGLFSSGGSLVWLAVTPAKWATGAELAAHFAGNWGLYLAQFLVRL